MFAKSSKILAQDLGILECELDAGAIETFGILLSGDVVDLKKKRGLVFFGCSDVAFNRVEDEVLDLVEVLLWQAIHQLDEGCHG